MQLDQDLLGLHLFVAVATLQSLRMQDQSSLAHGHTRSGSAGSYVCWLIISVLADGHVYQSSTAHVHQITAHTDSHLQKFLNFPSALALCYTSLLLLKLPL